MSKKFKKIIAMLLTAITVFALPVLAYAAEDDEALTVDKDGTYHARLGFQAMTTDSILWIENLGYYDSDLDIGRDHIKATANNEDSSYSGEWVDAEIKGNGTYTVEFTSSDIGGVSTFTQLQVATDIPKTDEIKFTDLQAYVNDNFMYSYPEVFMDDDKCSGAFCCAIAYNNWRSKLKEAGCMNEACIPETGDVKFTLTFTVSGFNYDKEVEETEAPETEAPATEAAADKSDSDNAGGLSTTQIVLICVGAAVVVIVIIVVVVSSKKKKNA